MTTPDEINRIRVELGLPPRGGTPTPPPGVPGAGITPDRLNEMRAELGLPPRNYDPPGVSTPLPGGPPAITSPAPPPGGVPSPAPSGGGLLDTLGNAAQGLIEPIQQLGGMIGQAITDPAGHAQMLQQRQQEWQADPMAGLQQGMRTTPEAEAAMAATDVLGGGLRTPIRAAAQALPEAAGLLGRVAGAMPPLESLPFEQADPIRKLTELVRAAQPVIDVTQAMRREEVSRRVGRAAGILESSSGREAFERSTSALAGRIPTPQFSAPEVDLGPDEIHAMFEHIRAAPRSVGYFDRLDAKDALVSVLMGEIPQRKELSKLEKIFNIASDEMADNEGTELVRAILSKRPAGNKLWENTVDALGLTRALQTTMDMSAPLRQGLVLAPGHPVQFGKSFVKMVQSYASENVAEEVDNAIQMHPNFDLFEQLGLYQAPRVGEGVALAAREEAVASKWANRIPGIKQSSRAYVTFLNKLRFDVVNKVHNDWVQQGVEGPELAENTQRFIRFVNWATGRGPLGASRLDPATGRMVETGPLAQFGPVLNASFFAPRLLTGRVMLPFSMVGSSRAVNKVIAKDLATFIGGGTTLLSLLAMRDDVDVETDSRSSDFGKIKVGPTRIDIWGGYQPLARSLVQLITGQRVAVGSGKVSNVPRRETLKRFVQSKFSPALGLATDLYTGETFMGEDLAAPKERFGVKVHPLANMAIEEGLPLFIQDMLEAFDEGGLTAGLLTAPAFFGTGAQTFQTVEDIAQKEYELPFTELWPHEQEDVRLALNVAQPDETMDRWDELEAEEQATFEELDQMAAGAFRTGAPSRSFEDILNARPSQFHRRVGEMLAGGAQTLGGPTPQDPRRDVVDQFFQRRSELATARHEVAIAGGGGTEAAYQAGQEVQGMPMFPVEPETGGTEQERTALEEYRDAAEQATSPESGIFDSAQYNAILNRLEEKWGREGTLQYVQASTNMEDLSRYPNLWAVLPDKTKARYVASERARLNLRRYRDQQRRGS